MLKVTLTLFEICIERAQECYQSENILSELHKSQSFQGECTKKLSFKLSLPNPKIVQVVIGGLKNIPDTAGAIQESK